MRRIPLFLLLLSACNCSSKRPAPDVITPPRLHDGKGPTYTSDHPRIYLARNAERLRAALDRKTPGATRYREMVDLQLSGGDDIYAFQAWYAALLGPLTGDRKYCKYAVDHVDAQVAKEEGLIAAGESPEIAGDSYLYVGERIGDLSLTYDWCFDQLDDAQKQRWLDYAAQAVWNVWHPDRAQWGGKTMKWSGWSVDDPSNNYYYSFLRATMLYGLAAHGEHEDADGWVTYFRVQKIGAQLVPTFEEQLVGGGSREGTGYGTAMQSLWELYDFWQGSTGEDIAGLTPHAHDSLLYYLHAIVPTRDRIAPIGDHARESTASLFDYERNYIQELSYLYRDDPVVPAAKALLESSTVPKMGTPFMYVYDFLYELPDVKATSLDKLGRYWYGPGIGELFARSSWDTGATWLSFIAGPYTQSHAHRDQGSLLLYKDGWLADDAIIDSHSGIVQDEEVHNLVRLAGRTQKTGTESKVLALHTGDGWLHVAADLTPAYDGDGNVKLDQREIVFLEPDCVVVFDRVTTDSDVDQIWQLNTQARPTTKGPRTTVKGGKHELQVDRITPPLAKMTVSAWSDKQEFGGGYRLDETIPGGKRLMLHVLSIGGAVTSTKASDADGRTGVAITFADGRKATVRFGAAGVDGTLQIGDTEASLGEGVDPLPEWLR